MNRKQFLLIISLVLLIGKNSYSQNEPSQLPFLKFENITSRYSLPSIEITCFFQDSKGFLWIGSNAGISRYDGYSVDTYSNSNTNNYQNCNEVSCIVEDERGFLWISSKGTVISRFDPRTKEFLHIQLKDNDDSLNEEFYISTLVVHNNKLWIGGTSCVYLLDLNSDYVNMPQFESYDMHLAIFGKSNNLQFVRSIVIDALNNVWVASDNGIYRIMFKDSNYKEPVYQTVISGIGIKVILDNEMNIWCCTNNKVFKIEQNGSQTIHSINYGSFKGMSSICFDKKGNFWIGLRSSGLIQAKINKLSNSLVLLSFSENLRNEPQSLSNSNVSSLFVDNTNVLWVGSMGGGIDKIDLEQKQFFHISKEEVPGKLSNNTVRCLMEDQQKNIWIGTKGSGIFITSNVQGTYNHFYNIDKNLSPTFKPLCSNDIFYIFESKHYPGHIYCGSEGDGFSVIKKFSDKNIMSTEIYTPKEFRSKGVTSFLEEANVLWIGTYRHGLYKASRNKNGELTNIVNYRKISNDSTSLTGNIVRSIVKDLKGNIWIGTSDGLNKLINDNGEIRFKRFVHSEEDSTSLGGNRIVPMIVSRNGSIWIGTFGAGLNKMISSKKKKDGYEFISYSINDGLPNNYVKAIIEDDQGNLWISTNYGLSKFDPIEETFNNYTKEDGLQGNMFYDLAVCKRLSGEMLFGGVNGFSAFQPDSIKKNKYLHQIVLTNFKIFDKPVLPGEVINGRIILTKAIEFTSEIVVSKKEEVLEFEFAATHYAAPVKNQYQFRLLGFDDDWIKTNANERKCRYTNLPAGEYVLEIMASNNDGVWLAEPLAVKLAVLSSYWIRWWTFIIYLFIFFTCMLLFRKYTIIRINKKNELLMEKFERDKISELAKHKLDFFTNISHEFRTPLTLIISTISKLFDSEELKENRNIQSNYKRIRRNINTLLRLIKQLSDFRKFDLGKLKLEVTELDFIEFSRQIFESFQNIANSKKIHFTFSSEKEKINLWFDTDKIEKVIFNLLSNALKFTLENGRVSIDIVDYNDITEIKISDNGIGIPIDRQKYIFDLFYRANRLNNMGVGIGLSFSKNLIEMHHGKMDFTSQEGKGTTFIVSLKKGKSHYSDDEIFNHKGMPILNLTNNSEWNHPIILSQENKDQAEKDKKCESFTILVIDDNVEIRQLIAETFKDYTIIEAGNGREGFEKALLYLPELIILDIMMPEMNGFELCSKMKSNDRTFQIPLVILSAKAEPEDLRRGFMLGVDDYFSKPFDISLLEIRIKAIITNRQKLISMYQKKVLLEPSKISISNSDEKLLKRALQVTERNLSDPEFTVPKLARELGYSVKTLNRKLKLLTRLTLNKFILSVRMQRASQLLKIGTSVAETANETGFNSIQHFRNCFKQEFNVTPSEFIKEKREERPISVTKSEK